MNITTTEYTTSLLEQQNLDCLEALKHNIPTFKKGNFYFYILFKYRENSRGILNFFFKFVSVKLYTKIKYNLNYLCSKHFYFA